MQEKNIGKIIKGVGGFYYIHLPDNRIFECKAKGVFRNQNIKPTVGDNVLIDIIDEQALTGNIMTMPGLPKVPAAERIDIDEKGNISGLF